MKCAQASGESTFVVSMSMPASMSCQTAAALHTVLKLTICNDDALSQSDWNYERSKCSSWQAVCHANTVSHITNSAAAAAARLAHTQHNVVNTVSFSKSVIMYAF
jgi:hypothetical protein